MSSEQIEVQADNSDNATQPESTEQVKVDASDQALVQALLFAHGEPLSVERLMQACGLTKELLDQVCNELRLQLEGEASGLVLVKIGDAYQLRTKPAFAEQIRLLKASAPKKLSAPALETLAIVAYRQPIIKSDVERIRGVDATPTMKTLLERNLIKIVGHMPSVGQPALYGTTEEFLKLFGLSSLEQLPTLKDLKDFDGDPGEQNESHEASEQNDDSSQAEVEQSQEASVA